MIEFNPTALGGGVLIGISIVLMMGLNGRITGISNFIHGAIWQSDRLWRVFFLSGLIAGAALVSWLTGYTPSSSDASIEWLVIAGFLVGLGTGIGSGCTSGHGICGLARLSPRSLVATLLFMGAGFITVAITQQLLGIN